MAKPTNGNNTANLGFEAKLWAAADALRNNMDAAEYRLRVRDAQAAREVHEGQV